MQILQRKQYGLGKFILATLVAVLILVFLVIPKFNEYRSVAKQLKEAEDITARLEQEDVEITRRLSEFQTQKDQIDLLNQAIPDRSDIPDLYAHLETLLKTSNLTLSAIQAVDQTPVIEQNPGAATGTETMTIGAPQEQQLTPTPSLGMVSVSLEAQGALEGYKQFLSSLEKSLRIIDVQNVEINTDENGILTYRITLRTYYQK